ncbi:tandem-95 repeat protein, partial [Gimesia aquarii]|uniref:tandem-95 repeat protein n=1 Tax=Gimesia aquarii TaxID=2527964 RepID=UPI0018D7116A
MLISNWLSALISRIQRRPRYNSRARRAIRKRWEAVQQNRLTTVDALEERTMLTTTLYLDFGQGFINGELNTTVYELATIDGVGNGYGTGTYLGGEGPDGKELQNSDVLTLSSLEYDFDGNGTFDINSDLTALANSVKAIIESTLEPFDIDVQIASSSSLTDAANKMQLNDWPAQLGPNPTGENDAYVFVTEMWSSRFGDGSPGSVESVGETIGANGAAAASDLYESVLVDGVTVYGQGNRRDEAVLVFADTIFSSTNGTQGTTEFGENLAQRLAYTATHEAFHTFSLWHTTGQLAHGDVILTGVENNDREDPFMVTRFDLDRVNDVKVTNYNNYGLIASDTDIGLRDSNNNGIPDIAYVTGTGAHDRITITKGTGSNIDVLIEAYSDTAMTSSLAMPETYSINLDTESDGTLLIDLGIGDDEIVIDSTIDALIRVRGGGGDDTLKFSGTPDQILHTVGADFSVASELTTNGTTVTFQSEDIEFIDDRSQQQNGATSSVTILTGSDDDDLKIYTRTIDGSEVYRIQSDRKTVGFSHSTLSIDAGAGTDSITVYDDLVLQGLQLDAEFINLNTGLIETVEDQIYDGSVKLDKDTTLNGKNVIFNGTLDQRNLSDENNYFLYETDYHWDDISGSGTGLNLILDTNNKAESGLLNLGFDFQFFENLYSGIYVNAHGFVTFTGNQNPGVNPTGIPETAIPNNLIAGWWSILSPGDGSVPNPGQIYYELQGTPGDRVFVIQYDEVQHLLYTQNGTEWDNPAPVSFQIRLYESGSEIEVHYKDAPLNLNTAENALWPHFTGIENASGTISEVLPSSVTLNGITERSFRYSALSPTTDIVDLTINTTESGTTTFNGVVGGTNALGNITTNSDGTTEINADINLSTGHTLDLNDAVVFNSDVTLTAPQINVHSTLEGVSHLTLAPTSNLTLVSGSTFRVALNGTTAVTEYDQLILADTIDLTGVNLDVVLDSYTPDDNTSYTIIKNDSANPIQGTFNGLPEGADVVFGSTTFRISYLGGDGNDVVLTANNSNPFVTSITASGTTTTNSETVQFRVYFSEAVSGLDASDFAVNTTGTLTGVSIDSISQINDSYYRVYVSTGQDTGNESGSLKLDLIDDDTIIDVFGNSLGGTGTTNGNFTSGEVFTIDFIHPTAPVITGMSDDSGINDSDQITNDGFPTFVGTAEVGSIVTLKRDSLVIATAVTDAQGDWSAESTVFFQHKTHTVTATATDAAGNKSNTSVDFILTVDHVTDAPVFNGLSAGDSGTNTDDEITNEETFTLSGTAEANGEVIVYLNGSNESIGTATVDSSGNWNLQYEAIDGDGDYIFTANTKDVAGNLSVDSAEFTVTLDNVSDAPVMIGVIDDTGINGTNNVTRDQELTLYGTTEANSIVTVYRTDLGSDQELGTTTADDTGKWTYEYNTSLAAGTTANPETYTFKATASDIAGNAASGFSNILSVDIVNDSEEGAEVRVDLRVVTSKTNTDSTTGELGVPIDFPENTQFLDEWGSYWVEIWLSTPYAFDPGTPGIQSADIDLVYNTNFTSAIEIEYGAAFTASQTTPTIDDIGDGTIGTVTNISASTALTGIGVAKHLLFARVKFEATANDQVALEVERTVDIPNGTVTRSLVMADPGFNASITEIVNDSNTVLNSTNSGAKIGDLPETQILPNIYDYDDDDSVNFRDLTLFASQYQFEPTDYTNSTESEFEKSDNTWLFDTDKSGQVNFRDLTLFASNYQRSKSGTDTIYYPTRFFTEELYTSESELLFRASSVMITNLVADEDANTLTIEVTNTDQLGTGFSVDVETTDLVLGADAPIQLDEADVATAGTDFSSNINTLNFSGTAGEKQYITVPLIDDNVVEFDEKIYVNLNNLQYTGDGVIEYENTIAFIQDNDFSNISISDETQSEGGVFSFEVTLDNPASENVSVWASLEMGTTDVSDFVDSTAKEIVFLPGETSKTVTFTLIDDTILEGAESFNVKLTDPKFAGETDLTRVDIVDAIGAGTINDNDSASLSIDDLQINENQGTATFTVTLDNDVDTSFTVDFATADNHSVAGTDYLAKSGTLNFAGIAGETQSVTITISDDSTAELDESFFVNLSNVQASGRNVTLADSQGVGTILGNDTGTAGDDNYLLRMNADGVTLELLNNLTLVDSRLLSDLTSINIDGGDGDDTLTLDLSNGLPFPVGTINFNGGANVISGDSLSIIQGSYAGTFGNITHTFTSNSDGSINIDGQIINYTGLEPITDDLIAANRVFDFAGADETITLSDDATTNDGILLIDSTLGESVSFATATSSLTILTGNGSGADVVNVEGLDGLNASDLTITGDTDDDVNFQTNSTVMGVNDLNVTAQTITVDSSVTSTSGAISLTASRNLVLSDGSSLSTVDGGITLLANNGGTTAGDFIGIVANNATIQSTGNGNVSLTSNSGSGAGIYLHGGTSVTSTATGASAGTISLNGTGGSAASYQHGILLIDASISSVDGAISLTGQGGGDGTAINNNGLYLHDSSISSTGTGVNAASITLNGTAGNGISINRGIRTAQFSLTSVDGDIAITGQGAGDVTGNSNEGIVFGAPNTITSTGTAAISIHGSAGAGLTYNQGISVSSLNDISSVNADITMISDGHLLFSTNSNMTATSGNLQVTANYLSASNTGNMTINGNAIFSTGSGDIDLDASGDISLTSLVATGTVTVDSTSGSILDNGDVRTDIHATTAILNALNSVGTSGNPLETSVANLSGTGTNGGFHVNNSIYKQIIDDGDAGFSISGSDWVHFVWDQYYQNDAYYILSGGSAANGSNTASWAFSGLNAGRYRLTTTWNPGVDRADNVPYSVSGIVGGTVNSTFDMNTLTPDVTDDGVNWESLGYFDVAQDGTLTVSISDNLVNGTIYAQAMRLEQVHSTLSVSDVSVNEDAGTATFTVTSSMATGAAFSVDYATANGTAIAGSDYNATSGTLNFTGTAGETQTITVNLNNDNTVELDENFFVNLSNVQSPGLLNIVLEDSQASGTITNDDTTIMSLTNVSVAEWEGDSGTTTFHYVVNISNPLDVDFHLWGRALDDTATEADGDFTDPHIGYWGTIAAGATSAAFQYSTNGDTKIEDHEFFKFAFPRNAIYSDIGTATPLADGYLNNINFAGDDQSTLWATGVILNDDFVKIIDDGDAGFSISGSDWVHFVWNQYYQNDAYYILGGGSAADGSNTASWAFSDLAAGVYRLSTHWNQGTGRADNVPFSVSGIVGGTANGTFDMNTLNADVTDDGVNWEDLGYFEVAQNGTLTVSISDNLVNGTIYAQAMRIEKASALSISDVTIDETAGTATLSVTSSRAVGSAFSVDFATADGTAVAGTDYTATSGTLNFTGTLEGETKTITVNLTNDLIVESDETLLINLSNLVTGGQAVTLAQTQATVTITDNDSANLSIADVTVNESTGTATFVVTLDQAVQGGVAVDWSTADGTAVAGTDYTAGSGTLNFTGTANETQTITVTLNNEAMVEFDETLQVNLSNLVASGNVTLTESQATATVTDDDGITINGTAGVDDFLLQLNADGVTLEVWNDVTLVYSDLLTNITGINLLGDAGADTFTIDLNNGLPFPTTINFDGGADGGALVLNPGSYAGTITNITHTLNSNSDGSVTIDGQTINYISTETLSDNLDVTSRVFDFIGAAETVTLSDSGTGSDGLSIIDSTLGAAVTFVSTASVVTVSTSSGSGADTINVQGLDSLNAGNLAVTGDADDNVTFQTSNMVMDANDLTVTAQTIIIDSGISSTTGAISLTASRNILLNSGSSLTTVDGGITLLANNGGLTAGDFIGIEANNSLIQTTGTGNISLTGLSRDDSGAGFQYGVSLHSNTLVSSTSTGMITVDGTGGNGTLYNYGINVSSAEISSVNGNISLTGQGGDGTGISNLGIMIDSGSLISSTGTGINAATITLNGTAGVSSNWGHGVKIDNSTTKVTSVDGNILIIGQGSNNLGVSENIGVALNEGEVSSTGTGADAATITINGTGGAGTSNSYGTFLSFGALVTSIAGDIALTGQGGDGTGASNMGVFVDSGSLISSTGTGTNAARITLDGSGGTSTNWGYGVYINGSTTKVTSIDGDISITGRGRRNESGEGYVGVVLNGSEVVSTGLGVDAATITIDGTGGTGTVNNHGVFLANTASVTSTDGAILLTGEGGNGTVTGNYGVVISNNSLVTSLGTGINAATIAIDGTGGSGTSNNYGINLNNSSVTSADGNISLTGQGGSGTEISNIGVFIDNSGLVSSTGTGPDAATITINGTAGTGTNDNHGVLLNSISITSVEGDISLTGQGGGSGTGTNNTGIYMVGPNISSTGIGANAASITLNGTGGNGTANSFGMYLNGVTLNSIDGDISLTGQGGDGTGINNVGVYMDFGSISSTGTGTDAATITIDGTGGAGTNFNRGFLIYQGDITSVDGDISITGVGSGGNTSDENSNHGVNLHEANVTSTGTGVNAAKITIDGTGGTGQNSNVSTYLYYSDITSAAGDIAISGSGATSTGSHNYGVILQGGSVSSTAVGTDAATITIDGTGGTGTDYNHGVFIAAGSVTSVDGAVAITGTGGGNGSNNWGIHTSNGAITSTGTGTNAATITIDGTGGTGTGERNYGTHLWASGLEYDLVTSVDGNIVINGQGGSGAGGVQYGLLTSNGTISSTGTGPEAATITINVNGGTGGSSNHGTFLSITEVNSHSGDISIISEDDALLGGNASINSTSGDVIVTADNAVGNNGGFIIIFDGSLIDAGSGNIDLDADIEIYLGGLQTTGHVTIDSTSGSILDHGDTHVDIIAGTANINAAGSIGTGANPLETQIGSYVASSGTNNGNINNRELFSINDVTANEDGSFVFTVSLSRATDQNVTVLASTSTGSAGAGDFTAISNQLVTIAAGQTSATVTVNVTNDSTIEGTETFNIVLSDPKFNGATNLSRVDIADGTGVGTIIDNDFVKIIDNGDAGFSQTGSWFTYGGNPTFYQNDYSYVNGFGNGSNTSSWAFTNLPAGTYRLSGNWVPHSIRATNIPVTISGVVGGDVSTTINQEVLQQDVFDDGVYWQDLGYFEVANDGTITVTISDDQTNGNVLAEAYRIEKASELSVSNVTVDEAAGTATFSVTSSRAVGNAFSVDFATANGTAVAGTDYTANSGTLNFTGTVAGETQTITVNLTNDAAVEADETLLINLSNLNTGGQAIVLAQTQATATISDNDSATLSIADVTVNENAGTATFTVTLDQAVQGGLTIDWSTADGTAVAGTDYTAGSGTLNFTGNAGETQTITVTLSDDSIVELDKDFFVNLSNLQASGLNVTIADSQALGTISNDDSATLSIADLTVNENAGTATFTVTLDQAVQGGLTIDWATADGTAVAGTDYTAGSGTLNFTGNAGETQTITVTLSDDSIAELDKDFFVNLSNLQASGLDVTLADSQALGTISNDDSATLSIADLTVNENTGTATFTVTLDQAVQGGVAVNWSTANGTAVAGTDYTAGSGILNFTGNAGETQTITVTLIDDSNVELSETFLINLTNLVADGDVTLSQNQATAIITNDDSIIIDEDALEQTVNLTGIVASSSGLQVQSVTATSDNTTLIPNPAVTYTPGNTTGTLNFTPQANQHGSAVITVTVTDELSIQSTHTFTVVVNPVNDAPVVNDLNFTIDEDLLSYSNSLSGDDVDSDDNASTLTYLITPAGAPVTNNNDGTFQVLNFHHNLAVNEERYIVFTYTATDSHGVVSNVGTVTITVTGDNDAPTLNNESLSISEDSVSTTTSILASDSDSDDDANSLVYTITNQPAKGTVISNGDGTFTFSPGTDFEDLASGETSVVHFNFTAVDSHGLSGIGVDHIGPFLPGSEPDYGTVTITVTGANDAPVAVDDTFTVDEDSLLSTGNVLHANPTTPDSDIEGNTLTVSEVNGVAANVGMQITLTSGALLTVNANGTFSYDPNGEFESLAAGQTATETFTYTIDDGNGGIDIATVTITITGVNDLPTLDPISVLDPIDEDAGQQTINLTGIFAGGGETQTLTVTASSDNTALIADPVVAYTSANPTGSLTYTPIANQSGSASITVTVDDGQMGIITQTFTVIVNSINDAPVASDANIAATEDGVAVTTGILASDVDTDNDPSTLTYNIVMPPAEGTANANGDGTFTFDPGAAFQDLAAGETRQVTFTYTTTDAHAAVSNTGTVTVTVTGVNDAPVASDANIAATEDGLAVTTGILASDVDTDNDPSTLTYNIVMPPAEGTANSNGDGTFTFDPGAAFQDLAAGETRQVTFTYTATDAHAAVSNTGTVTVTVTGVNDTPTVGSVLSSMVNEDQATYSLDLLAGATDTDTSDILSVSDLLLTLGDDAGITINPNTLDIDPTVYNHLAPGQSEIITYTYNVTDGNGGTVAQSVTITITGVNDAPVALDANIAATEDGLAVTTGILASDVDTDNDPSTLTYNIVMPPAEGTANANGDGTFTFDPGAAFQDLAAGETRQVTFTYTATDAHAAVSNTGTVTVTVTGVNDTPTVGSVLSSTVNEDQATYSLDLLAGATDTDTSDTLSVSDLLLTLGDDAGITINPNTLDIDPTVYNHLAPGQSEIITYTYNVTDGNGGTVAQSVTITITGVNDAPVANNANIAATEDGLAVTTGILASDVDTDNDPSTLTYNIVMPPAEGTANANGDGTFTFDPGAAFQDLAAGETRQVTFTYTATDAHAAVSNTGTVTVTVTGVNDATTATADAFTTNDNATVSGNLITADNGNGADTDIDTADTLSITHINGVLLTPGVIVLPSLAELTIAADGTFTYDPSNGFADMQVGDPNQADSFTYTLSDGQGGTDTATVSFTIVATNDAPVALDANIAATEDGLAVTTGILASDVDTDNDASTLTYNIVMPPAEGTANSNGDGTFTFDPGAAFQDLAAGETRQVTFTYTATDAHAAVSNTGTVTITVTGVNDAPAANNDAFATDENTSITAQNVFNANPNSADTDVESQAFNVTAVNGIAANVSSLITLASGALLTLNHDGTFVYDPNGSFDSLSAGVSASDLFSYTITDNQGGTDTATVSIIINGINDAPIVLNESIAVVSDGSTINTSVLADDVDNDDDPISLTYTIISAPLEGTALVNHDGSFNFDPGTDFQDLLTGETRQVTFTYTATDVHNAISNTGTVTVTVTGVNDAPVASDANIAATEDGVAVTTGILASDVDTDNDPSTLTYNIVMPPAEGTANANGDGTFTFDPGAAFQDLAAGETRQVTFTYTATDAHAAVSNTGTVTITVTGVNDATTATADAFTTNDNATVSDNLITADNGNGTDTDIDTADTLSITHINGVLLTPGVIVLPSLAELTIAADGTFTYDPSNGFADMQVGDPNQADSFTYTLSDGQGGTDTATVSFTIVATNDAPVALDANIAATEDGLAVTTGILASDVDTDNDASTLTYNIVMPPAEGTANANGDGTFTFDPGAAFQDLAAGETRQVTFTYTATDAHAAVSNTGTVTVTVTGVNDATTATADAFTTNDNATVSGNLITADNGNGADTDIDTADTLTITHINGVLLTPGVIVLPSLAELTIAADGTFTYDPSNGFADMQVGDPNQADSFTYTLSDGQGGTDTATVSFTIVATNDAPVALDANIAATEDGLAVTTGILASDVDTDNDASTLTYNIVMPPAEGTANSNGDGTFTFDPGAAFQDLAAGETRQVTFTYTATDAHAAVSNTGTVTITVTGVNDATTATADAFTTNDNATVSGNLITADNGNGTDTDIDTADTLSITHINGVLLTPGVIVLPSLAELTIAADGTFT